MKYLSTSEIRAIDENAEYLGVSRRLLMENAGRAVADTISKRVDVKGKKVLIVSYVGNKGGDGFVAARHLACRGADVTVLLLAKPEAIATDEAKSSFNAITNMEFSVKIIQAADVESLKAHENLFSEADVIVDAMLGTGVKGVLKPPISTAVELINKSGKQVFSIDVPTGLNPDTGEVHGVAVKASVTVTHHCLKKGFEKPIAKEYLGEVEVSDIGIPPEAELFAGPGDVRSVYRVRSPYSHKGENGVVLVVGGSKWYTGAPAHAALAALRSGVDLAIVAAPSAVANTIRSFSPDIIVHPYEGDVLNDRAVEEIVKELDRFNSVIVGPGLGYTPEVAEASLKLIEEVVRKKPCVIDADALKALRGNPSVVRERAVILTPHAGEFFMLTGQKLPREENQGWKDRIPIVREWAFKLGCTMLLKSHYDVISDGERIKVNRTGTPAMTVGGTGDTLTGIIAAFLAWGAEPFKAAVAGAFVNGLAGELVESEVGHHMLASDVVDKIPLIFKKLGLP